MFFLSGILWFSVYCLSFKAQKKGGAAAPPNNKNLIFKLTLKNKLINYY